MGEYTFRGNTRRGEIDLFLAKIARNHSYYEALPPGINAWLALLEVTMHEIGHHNQGTQPGYRDDYDRFGYECCYPERDARWFAWHEMLRLAELDPFLFAPRHVRDLGWLGGQVNRALKEMRDTVYATNNWRLSNTLREARLHAIHVPKQEFADYRDVVISEERALKLQEEGACAWFDEEQQVWKTYKTFKKPNPLVPYAREHGIAWHDARGHEYLYLPPGAAIQAGLLDHGDHGLVKDESIQWALDFQRRREEKLEPYIPPGCQKPADEEKTEESYAVEENAAYPF